MFDLIAATEDFLIAGQVKGGPGSGNWGHTSIRRTGQVGGSDPGGGLSAIGIGYGSTPEERREMAAQYRTARAQAPAYRPFSTVAEADEWLAANRDWTGGVSMKYDYGQLTQEQRMETAATLRQMKELSPGREHYTEAGVVFNPGGTNSHYYNHGNAHGAYSEVESKVEVGLAESKGAHSDTMLQVKIEELELQLATSGYDDPYSEKMIDRWKELQEFKETGRWEETYPHSKYMYGDKPVRAILVHESGHWVHDEINRRYMFLRVHTRTLAQRYHDSPAERRKIGVTRRGMDSFNEAMAEGWSTYVAGKRHMIDPDMAKVFDVWTGQREREEAWPQYAGPNPKIEIS